MSDPKLPADFVLTREHRRFAEFCDACRRYRYISLCYGSPGVGKTLSARHYTNWEKVEACLPCHDASEAALAAASDNNTVFYTPKVVNSPAQVERDIQLLRHRLHSLLWEQITRQEYVARDALQRREKERRDPVCEQDWLTEQEEHGRQATPFAQVAATYHQKRLDTPDRAAISGFVQWSGSPNREHARRNEKETGGRGERLRPCMYRLCAKGSDEGRRRK